MTAHVYVDPDATGDADGTSWTHAYTSLATAEAALPGTAISEPYVIHCRSSAGTADTTGVAFSGSYDPGTTNTITVQSDDDHGGVYSTSAYRLESSGDPVVNIQEDNVFLVGIQIKNTNATGSRSCLRSQSDTHALRCILIKEAGGTSNIGFINGGSSGHTQIETCLIDIYGSASSGVYQSKDSADSVIQVYSTTIVNCNTGVYNSAGGTDRVSIRNCLFYNNGTDVNSDVDSDTDYNATDNASLGYTSSTNDQTSRTFTFVASGSGDYNLASGDTGAKDLGTNTASSPFYTLSTTDIKGGDRTGSWDIGMSEIAATSAGTIRAYMQRPIIKHILTR